MKKAIHISALLLLSIMMIGGTGLVMWVMDDATMLALTAVQQGDWFWAAVTGGPAIYAAVMILWVVAHYTDPNREEGR